MILQTPVGMLFNKIRPTTLVDNLLIDITANSPFILGGKPFTATGNLLLDSMEDAGFVDASAGNYNLEPESQVFMTLPNFEAIPFNNIGLLP
jgi:hypothetical protein